MKGDKSMNKFKAEWSGCYPSLCFGKWTLYKNEKDISHLIPDKLREKTMYTFGKYQSWHFEDWIEVFEDYYHGMKCDEWIDKNRYWLDAICDYETDYKRVFKAFQKSDFRTNSCGGCI
ncbi:hypothetical protein B7939_00595 [Eggerthia catenaformis]|nr:hypothetical protein B7939_00595 [Eggerthia catenaformis]